MQIRPNGYMTMNILLIDDHTLFRSGIETMLTSLEPKTSIQGYSSCVEAVNSITAPDSINLILLDYHMPGSEAVSNIKVARDEFENAKVVILSGEEEPAKIIEAIDCGVSGFIPKSSEPQVLVAALRLILAGGVYLPKQVLRYQSNANGSAAVTSPDNTPTLEKLSDRQLEVLMHVIDGKNNKTIAREINLSLGTIKAHLSAAYDCLGVSNRTEAVVIASKLLRQH